MAKTRIERLWDKLDTLKAALSGNPHCDLNKARKVVAEIEALEIQMRRAELKRKLRKK
jgi:predicted  nucleic acid-binding Zn-ribbon protein